jgi:hypothetical protein
LGWFALHVFSTQEERNTFFDVDLKAQAQGVTDLGNHTR